MDKTIIASFESIDLASIAASNAKQHCQKVKEVKVSYNGVQRDRGFSSFAGVFPATGISFSTPGFQGGVYPLPISTISPLLDEYDFSGHSNDINSTHATVKIVVGQDSVHNVCATLRQGGGTAVSVN